jgi:Kef-type K+ transport system membrane component KefB/nucleotide-binding universal stress UspA family protein
LAVWVSLPAVAAEAKSGSSPEIPFFLALAVLVIAGRVAGELFQRIGQPTVMGQLLAGVILGPTVLGRAFPDLEHRLFASGTAQMDMVNAVAQLGILLLLLLTGMETDLPLVRKTGRAAVAVSVAGILIPFVCGVALGELLPTDMLPDPEHRLVTSLFLGTALSISSIKIVAVVLREMNFMRRNLGQIIVATAIIDDTLGWIIIAVIISLARTGTVDPLVLAKHILGAAAFLLISFTVGRRVIFALIRWTNDHFVSDTPVISVIIGLMLIMALITNYIGLHTVLGAFVCGILVGESPILTRQIEGQLRGLIASLFMPVFFAVAGLSADLGALANPRFLALTGALIVIATVGKGIGAFSGGRIAGLSSRECLALAFGMNARGSTEVIVASIGLSLGMLSPDIFTVIVTMAILTTIAMPATLRWSLARIPMRAEEQKRLEREEFEERGFVANLERILVAVDESGNGQFASRLAGLLAGRRSISTTVLQLGRKEASQEDGAANAQATAEAATQSAEQAEDKTRGAQITKRRSDLEPKAAVSAEAGRGYDLLFIGFDQPIQEDGTFRARIARAASGFDGALAILVAQGRHLEHPRTSPLNIIVPVDRSEIASRAAEVAFGIGRGARAPVTALQLFEPMPTPHSMIGRLRSRLYQETALKNAAKLAEHFDVQIRTMVSPTADLVRTIAGLATSRASTLVVLGVHRSAGQTLDFGAVATSLAKQAKVSLLFVAS